MLKNQACQDSQNTPREKKFRFPSVMGSEKRVQNCCSTQKLYYFEKLYLFNLKDTKLLAFLITGVSCLYRESNKGFCKKQIEIQNRQNIYISLQMLFQIFEFIFLNLQMLC